MIQFIGKWRNWISLFVLAVALGTNYVAYAWQDTPAPEVKKEEEKKDEAAAPAATAPTTEEAAPITVPETLATDVVAFSFNNFALFLCAVLVIFMQAGFALVETGLNASKNAVNIMFKNFMDFCVGALLFFLIGYGIMYPGLFSKPLFEGKPGVFQIGGIGVPASNLTDDPADLEKVKAGELQFIGATTIHPSTNFMFQVAFAATAATIVSGSVAGRIKFGSYVVYTAIITAFIYPVSGMWMWGGGWLAQMGFRDFAGSIVVHSVGGMAGLAGAIVLGPRIGRFVNGKSVPIPGHNLPFVALGVFILMIGWYGFNPGSQLAFTGVGNVSVVMDVALNTTLAACAGGVVGTIVSWVFWKKPDLTFALNGTLAGLVGITANCHCVSMTSSIIIGGVAGVLVILATILLDKLQIDDPVGAFQVHGFCGIWGGLATGIFGIADKVKMDGVPDLNFTTQLIGTLAIGGWALGASLVMFYGLKLCGMLRVPAEEEIEGLDITEHGMYAYPPQLVVDSFPGARPPAAPPGAYGSAAAGATAPAHSHA